MRARELDVRQTEPGAKSSTSKLVSLIPYAAVAVAAVLWLLSLRGLDLRQMNDYGLVSVLPPTYFAALAVIIASFAFAINRREVPDWVLLLHVVVLVAIIYGTPSLAYGSLRYSWAWKHVGMVDFIQRHGTVDPNVSSLADLSANQNWPGFFTLGALLTEAGGFSTALPIAPLAPLFFNLVIIGALLLILGAFVEDRRVKWLAVWIFFLANWIGQDYFAPQALSYYLFLVIVGICLTWFSARPRSHLRVAGAAGTPGRFEGWWGRLSGPPYGSDHPVHESTPLQRVALMAMIIASFAVIASSHQLTPLAAILSIGALVVAYRCSARSLPVLMGVITAMWTAYAAWAFLSNNLQWILHPFGQLNNNVSVSDLSRLSDAQRVVALTARGLTLLVGALGLAGLVRRWRSGQRDISYVVLAIAPFPMLGVTSYGGEMAFRVYFFALPYVAFFAAALFYPRLSASSSSWRMPAVVAAVSLLLASAMLLSYYGRERMNYFTPEEVAASDYLYSHAAAGSLIIGATYNYPSQYRSYEQYSQTTLAGQGVTRGQLQRLSTSPGDAIDRLVTTGNYPAVYIIITRAQKAHIEMDNLLPPGNIDRVEQFLKQSDSFKLEYSNRDAEVFSLVRQGGAR